MTLSHQTAIASQGDFAPRVIAWQQRHGRHGMPWQETRDPYRVWISEIMLQQTQVSTVLAYYERFLNRFPDVAALARAPLDDVLAAWSGLGYYRRARFAHQCAQAVMQQHGGAFPASSATLAQLPGIGRSTAAAIAAFCFDERAAILDGNVKRVLTRFAGFGGDLHRAGEQQRLWAIAESLLPHDGIATYTQGLMDLGAGVCLARKPLCQACPVADACVARGEGQAERYPVITSTLKRSERMSVWLWLEHQGRVWLTQRAATGVWAGLWSLPEFADFESLRLATEAWPGYGEPMPSSVHALTHLDWTLHPRRWCLPDEADTNHWSAKLNAAGPAAAGRWATPAQALSLGLPTPWRRLMRARTEPSLWD